MKSLSETWFAEGYVDFELKKYTLLAYLQEINRHFTENRLYPQLADVIFHYNNLVSLRDNKRLLQEQFPKRLTGIQIEQLQLLYQQMVEDDELMKELEDIMHYATGELQTTISSGTEIYEFVEHKMTITPVGLIPLDLNEGYLFLSKSDTRETLVYQYRLSIYEKHDEKYRSIKTEYVDSWRRTFANTYENIKTQLIRNRTVLPNPAVYAIEVPLTYPVEETLLPIAKRSLVRYITVPTCGPS
jgi:hypothetical protein